MSPSFPSDSPYVTAVGSTAFANGSSGAQTATTEFGSGGGFSFNNSRPSYQTDAVSTYLSSKVKMPSAGCAGGTPPHCTGRATPDVSFFGERFPVIDKPGTSTPDLVGGTSASTPSFGGVISRLNEERLKNGKVLGFVNPLLYKNPSVLTDVSLGSNIQGDGFGELFCYGCQNKTCCSSPWPGVPGGATGPMGIKCTWEQVDKTWGMCSPDPSQAEGWNAAPGWDPATGLGTPDFPKMLALVKGLNARELAR